MQLHNLVYVLVDHPEAGLLVEYGLWKVHGECEGHPSLGLVLGHRQRVEQGRRSLQFVGEGGELLRLVGLRTHVHTATALPVEIVEATEALLAARTVFHVAVTTLRQHALAHDRPAHLFIARVRAVCKEAH